MTDCVYAKKSDVYIDGKLKNGIKVFDGNTHQDITGNVPDWVTLDDIKTMSEDVIDRLMRQSRKIDK